MLDEDAGIKAGEGGQDEHGERVAGGGLRSGYVSLRATTVDPIAKMAPTHAET